MEEKLLTLKVDWYGHNWEYRQSNFSCWWCPILEALCSLPCDSFTFCCKHKLRWSVPYWWRGWRSKCDEGSEGARVSLWGCWWTHVPSQGAHACQILEVTTCTVWVSGFFSSFCSYAAAVIWMKAFKLQNYFINFLEKPSNQGQVFEEGSSWPGWPQVKVLYLMLSDLASWFVSIGPGPLALMKGHKLDELSVIFPEILDPVAGLQLRSICFTMHFVRGDLSSATVNVVSRTINAGHDSSLKSFHLPQENLVSIL